MTDATRIAEAIAELEHEQTYRKAAPASIPDTLEAWLIATPAVAALKTDPSLATELLVACLARLPRRDPDFARIGLFVALGELGQRKALPCLAAYLMSIEDGAQRYVGHIDHPFRFALRAIERITGVSLGLGPGEDLPALFRRRHEIARSLSIETSSPVSHF